MSQFLTAGPRYRRDPSEPERDYVPTYHPRYVPRDGGQMSARLADSQAFPKPKPLPVRDLGARAAAQARARHAIQRTAQNTAQPTSDAQRILAALERERREWTSVELAAALKIPRNSVSTYLGKFCLSGKAARRTRPGGHGRERLFRLAGVPITDSGDSHHD